MKLARPLRGLLARADHRDLAAALADLPVLPLADSYEALPKVDPNLRRPVTAEDILHGLAERVGVLLPTTECECIRYRSAHPSRRERIALGVVDADQSKGHGDQPTTAAMRARRRRAAMTRKERKAANKARLQRAVRRREALIIELAPDLRCAECGEQFEHPRRLQIDHVDGKAWTARRLSPSSRVARYWREFLAGVPMRALCGSCNCSSGCNRRGLMRPGEVPF